MCWSCDNPTATMADALRSMQGLIDEHGWALQGVEGEGKRPPFTYTVGLTRRGLPELCITGIEGERSAPYLNEAARELVSGGEIRPGGSVHVLGMHFEVVEMAYAPAHLNTAVNLYGDTITGWQLVWPDRHGRWPWDEQWAERWAQPLLGELNA
ncbi:uncharacterized protein DUF4262 [Motilibacter rhizosphaerae]|uniref:Uncharacterized protein DUF4262 n=1 Tax=Motilibacter rhizosphaerae TaxID=598652 RepID=A0A4Q7NNR2_9ACTN|nr:DUF4262 domain-containing protein [Motilibacter rhizosphaerae]RZS86879.1 uncharacterized protein DUF4262 [Motilibacter rhizosphaerae]